MTLSPLPSPALMWRSLTVHELWGPWVGSFTLCCVGHHKERQHKESPINYFLDFCRSLICRIQTNDGTRTRTNSRPCNCKHISMPHTHTQCYGPTLPRPETHCLPSEQTLIRNESFWSVAVGCQISSDIISPKNSLLPSFNIHSYTFNLPLCICNTVRRVCIQRCPNLLPKCIQFLETHMIPTLHVYCNAR